jgi:hypothetical protein
MIEVNWLAPELRIPALVAGALLVLFGRRLFWLFVGVVGFFLGYSLASGVFGLEPDWARFGLAALGGAIGILLAIFLQKLAVAVAGFLVGAWTMAGALGIPLSAASSLTAGQALLLFLAGILAALLAVWLFGITLVVLSSLAGAGLIADAIPLAGPARLALVAVLLIMGVVIQTQMTARKR